MKSVQNALKALLEKNNHITDTVSNVDKQAHFALKKIILGVTFH